MVLDNYMSQGIHQHTTGITSASAVKVNGAVTAGATTLAIDGTALVGKLVKGDVLTIDGKTMWSPRTVRPQRPMPSPASRSILPCPTSRTMPM